MSPPDSHSDATAILAARAMPRLLEALGADGRTVIGPTLRDGVVVLDVIDTVDDLPVGHGDVQAPGRYRLRHRSDGGLFGYAVGPDSLRRFLTPPQRPVWRARVTGDGVVFEDARPEVPRYAFIGVRACDLAALAARERVPDEWAKAALEEATMVAVECTSSAATCFCASLGTGPSVQFGYDLVLTELFQGGHRFLLRSGSPTGDHLLEQLGDVLGPATVADAQEAEAAVSAAAEAQVRHLDAQGARNALATQLESDRWDAVATRCLSCGNCTMVCPTCFCSESAPEAPLGAGTSTQVERWDSCFTSDFSHLHSAGSVRPDTRTQYRQWLTHKLVTWWDQFDACGCVGCGRCLTWCPVGIDLTAEVPMFPGADR